MANLAIKGHASRGKDVIEILEMLGGKNYFYMDGFTEEYIYYICKEKDNRIHSAIYPTNKIVFTIEEFLEKYPYKVGDKVKYINNIFCIKSSQWDSEKNTVIYYIDADWSAGYVVETDDLKPYKEEIIENKNKLLQQLQEYFNNTPRDVIEKEWSEYDKYNEIGPTVNDYLDYVNKIRQF